MTRTDEEEAPRLRWTGAFAVGVREDTHFNRALSLDQGLVPDLVLGQTSIAFGRNSREATFDFR